ncbi:MAG: fibrobacter succinogenes major paralogous domain-containing protein [Bacteroidales bacterium]|nr:fibrobacter succinogenes major paralogous domain-containing protein [Bacteroidales bacterium]
MKKAILFTVLLWMTILMYGQQGSIGKQGFVPFAGEAAGLSTSAGQPIASQKTSPQGFTLCSGVQDAQFVTTRIDTGMCDNEVDCIYDFCFEQPVAAGTYDSTHYCLSQLGYDSLTVLHLVVNAAYEGYDTIYLLVTELPEELHPGRNIVIKPSVEGCDSTIYLMVYTCGDIATDGDGNQYGSVFVGHDCWTNSNMKTKTYTVAAAAIQNTGIDACNMIYRAFEYPDTIYNLATFGRLYTWYATVGVKDNSSDIPPVDAEGFVQGICPDGWHVPTELNIRNLMDNGVMTIASDSLWLIPTGNNATGFNALPAGYYNPVAHRFENLHGDTHFWSSETATETTSKHCSIEAGCHLLFNHVNNKNFGFSVRCVKDDKYLETVWEER